MTSRQRTFTATEAAAAERLKKLWNTRKKDLKLTQEKVAQMCDWGNQSAFGAYLHARVPLNTEAVLKLAKALKVHPVEIMPELAPLLPKKDIQQLNGEYASPPKKTARQKILENYEIAKGLHDLAADQTLVDAMQIADDEFRILTTIDLPKDVSKNDYLQLLITIRAITDK